MCAYEKILTMIVGIECMDGIKTSTQ
jgi:hypothetical protein